MPSVPRIVSWEGESLPAEVPWERLTCAIVESASRTAMLGHPSSEAVRAEAYEAGVLFGGNAEIRWRKLRNGRLRFVAIEDVEGRLWPDGSRAKELERLVGSEVGLPDKILLWGEPRPGRAKAAWYESRIPQVLTDYPAEFAGKRVAVEVAHYRLMVEVPVPQAGKEEQAVTITRYCRLVPVVPEQEA